MSVFELSYGVWTRDGDPERAFKTFAAAEAYARRHVDATLRDTGHCITAVIDHYGFTVAHVRADGIGRVWTDVMDCTLV